MKYSDEQRLKKIVTTTEKLLAYLSDSSITREKIYQVNRERRQEHGLHAG